MPERMYAAGDYRPIIIYDSDGNDVNARRSTHDSGTAVDMARKIIGNATSTNLVCCDSCYMWFRAERVFRAAGPQVGQTGWFCSVTCYESWWNVQASGSNTSNTSWNEFVTQRVETLRKERVPAPEATPAVIALAAFGNVPMRAIRAWHELGITELDEVRASVADDPAGLLKAKGVGQGTVDSVRRLLSEYDNLRKMLGLS